MSASNPRQQGRQETAGRSGHPAGQSCSGHVQDRPGVTRQRCAIYTRVSTEQGLDMEFNSLDAQREACEAYITSQKHEGWMCHPGQYNDGGFSGGSLERPDLQRLMADIRSGRLDIIVVYKVDRLTRSLADFAKLVELFDAHGVSFVSVTQSFNTTSSMGRLTLNVLLSFAQFEREVTGERIRDKIAASKKKGIRMGGPVPLGYALRDKKLIINEQEAATVRHLFEGYLEHGTLIALMRHLDDAGIVTKRTQRKDGSIFGGLRFGKGSLAYLLRNRVYIGEITHHDQSYKGEHAAIIARDQFDAVQEALKRPGEEIARRRFKAQEIFPLADRILDDRGNRMTPTVAKKNGAHYRYYVSSALAQGRHAEAGTITRVPAQEIEDVIARRLREITASTALPAAQDGMPFAAEGNRCSDPRKHGQAGAPSCNGKRLREGRGTYTRRRARPALRNAAQQGDAVEHGLPLIGAHCGHVQSDMAGSPADFENLSLTAEASDTSLFDIIDRVIVTSGHLQLTLKPSQTGNGTATTRQLSIPWSPTSKRRHHATILPEGGATPKTIRPEARARLLLGIARARRWLDDLIAGRVIDTRHIARLEGCSERSVRLNLNLAFLPPTTVKAAIEGTLADGMGITQLVEAGMEWKALSN